MGTLGFLVATYNEEIEILDLLNSVRPYVDEIVVSDDGSEDSTIALVEESGLADKIVKGEHVASCEETRIRGLAVMESDWILILDADERIPNEYLEQIEKSIEWLEMKGITHVYFNQEEYLDGQHTRTFQKVKLARKDSLYLPEVIHGDISVEGLHAVSPWIVLHRKTTNKQIQRETEYIEAYKQKVAEGKMSQEWADKVKQWHYFVKE